MTPSMKFAMLSCGSWWIENRQCTHFSEPSVQRMARSPELVSPLSVAVAMSARARSAFRKAVSRNSAPSEADSSCGLAPSSRATVGLLLTSWPSTVSTKMPALVKSKICRYIASMAAISRRASRSPFSASSLACSSRLVACATVPSSSWSCSTGRCRRCGEPGSMRAISPASWFKGCESLRIARAFSATTRMAVSTAIDRPSTVAWRRASACSAAVLTTMRRRPICSRMSNGETSTRSTASTAAASRVGESAPAFAVDSSGLSFASKKLTSVTRECFCRPLMSSRIRIWSLAYTATATVLSMASASARRASRPRSIS